MLLSEGYPEMQLAPEDISAFCSYVLPAIEGHVTVEDPDALLREYLPEDTPAVRTPQLHRDLRNEKRASVLAQRYFIRDTQGWFLPDEEAVYQFLTEQLGYFREYGEVYLSAQLSLT